MRDYNWRKNFEQKKVKRRLKFCNYEYYKDVNGRRIENPILFDLIGTFNFHFFKRNSTHKRDSMYGIKWRDKKNAYIYKRDCRLSDKIKFKSILSEYNIFHFPKKN